MPWKKNETHMELKTEFVQLADQPDANISQLCRRYGISRPTGYKWLKRYQSEGLEGLRERSRRPRNSPNKTSAKIEQMVVEARGKDQGWGGRKLAVHLKRKARAGDISARPDQIPSPSTITAILDRHGLLGGPDDPGRRGRWQRFEREYPNELWQLDFKGEFRLANSSLCYPLTLIDDHSRFSLALKACKNQSRKSVQAHLREVFSRYGLPDMLLCDNGPPWGAGLGWRHWGPYYTGLAVWMIRLGIAVKYSRPYHPQSKGKNERFNGSLKAELLTYNDFSDHKQASRQMKQWRMRYNTVRPHQALDMQTPASRYQPSSRKLPAKLPDVRAGYSPDEITCKVNTNGRFRFQETLFTIGKAFSGYPLAIRASSDPHKYNVYFCHQRIRTIRLQ